MTVEQVRGRVRAEGLLPEDGVLVVMLSGGRDSVCLLDVGVAVCGAERVRALHVNYGLRPEAGVEERHCRELCERLGVRMEVVVHPGGAEEPSGGAEEPGGKAGEPSGGAEEPGGKAEELGGKTEEPSGNLHAWARELRYRAAGELAERLDTHFGSPRARVRARAVIATGHTSTDQVETILYRLAASPGRRALLGMAPREGRLVRPLLGITREQTAAYCRERGLSWCEDASNDDPRYARARVRHGLLRALESVHPAARSNVLRTAELLREETELLDGLVQAELEGRNHVSIERLRLLPPALQRLIVVRLAEDAAGTFVPQAGERVGELLALARRGGRAELHVGGLSGAVVEDGRLRFVKISPREQHAPHRGQ